MMRKPVLYAPTYYPDPEPLWPEGAPGYHDTSGDEVMEDFTADLNPRGLHRALRHVQTPAVQVYLAEPAIANGAAVVILPGGGFTYLEIDKEGCDIAAWLNTLGVAGIVVRYRTGPREDREGVQAACQADVRRAMQYTRNHAARWKIDPGKVGVIGFSAGGFLVASLGTSWTEGDANAADPLGRYSTRPDWLSWAYGGVRDEHLASVSEKTPPTFLAHAVDDRLPVENSVRFYSALRAKGVPVEMHLYAHGGHGFGLGIRGGPVASWTELYAEWLEGIIG